MDSAEDQLLRIANLPAILTTRMATANQLQQLERTGHILRVMPGRYVYANQINGLKKGTHQYRQKYSQIMLAAGITKLRPREVLSHHSAGYIHGFPSFTNDIRVHCTRSTGTSTSRNGFVLHRDKLAPDETEKFDELPVTTIARTAFDLARSLPEPYGLSALDFARRSGVEIHKLSALAQRHPGHGSAKTLKLLSWSTPGAESVQESACRYWLLQPGVREVETQIEFMTKRGRFRTDMLVRSVCVIYEYDGMVKYSSDSKALYNEKLREDALRDLGWTVVRVTVEDLRDPARFMARERNRLRHLGYQF